ncbi:ATPase, T2SS/T4P/T4SS family, partial [Acetobacter aceti]
MSLSPRFGKVLPQNTSYLGKDEDVFGVQHRETIVQWAELHGLCLERLDPVAVSKLPPERLIPEIERVVDETATEKRIQLNAREQKILANELVNDINGLGPIQPLLDDDSITDIMVNGPFKIFVEKSGKLVESGTKFRDRRHLMAVSQRIASAVGRRIDESSPTVDARLEDGSRVNIVFPPLALDGPYLSIRKFSRKKIDFKQ